MPGKYRNKIKNFEKRWGKKIQILWEFFNYNDFGRKFRLAMEKKIG